MKRCVVPLPIDVCPPGRAVMFIRSRAGAFFLGFFSCGIVAGLLAGLLPMPN